MKHVMSKNKIKKLYFEKGANALRQVVSIDQYCYCCPLCNRLYLPEAIDTDVLTLEHAPPEKVGGKPLALTCKECNSVAGYSIDSAVVHRERLFDFGKVIMGQKQNYEGMATLSMGGVEINVKMEVDKGIRSFKPVEEINNPQKIEAYKNYMMHLPENTKGDDLKFNITPRNSYNIKYSKIGDLKTAFIVCFAFFGYTYILDRRLLPVREQIINYKTNVIDHYWFRPNPKIIQKNAILLVKEPISAIVVKVDNSIVVLPWKGTNDLYKYLGENYGSGQPFAFKGKLLNWPETLEMKLDFLKSKKEQIMGQPQGGAPTLETGSRTDEI